jgi:hypothetical protein
MIAVALVLNGFRLLVIDGSTRTAWGMLLGGLVAIPGFWVLRSDLASRPRPEAAQPSNPAPNLQESETSTFESVIPPPAEGEELPGLPEVLGVRVDESGKQQELGIGPIRHDQLTTEQIARVARLRDVLSEVYPMTMEGWIDGFLRDMHPEQEIAILEACAVVFQSLSDAPDLTRDDKGHIYVAICGVSSGFVPTGEAVPALIKAGVTGPKQLLLMFQQARESGARP